MSNFLEFLNKGFEKKFLSEMADNRDRVIPRVKSQSNPLEEHIVKAFVYHSDKNNYNDYITTIANILNYCNGQLVKARNSKLKSHEYLNFLFGINDSFSVVDARNRIWTFQMNKGKEYPPFERTDEMCKKFYSCYKEMANYFSDYIAKDRKGEDKMEEFKEKVNSFIMKHVWCHD